MYLISENSLVSDLCQEYMENERQFWLQNSLVDYWHISNRVLPRDWFKDFGKKSTTHRQTHTYIQRSLPEKPLPGIVYWSQFIILITVLTYRDLFRIFVPVYQNGPNVTRGTKLPLKEVEFANTISWVLHVSKIWTLIVWYFTTKCRLTYDYYTFTN